MAWADDQFCILILEQSIEADPELRSRRHQHQSKYFIALAHDKFCNFIPNIVLKMCSIAGHRDIITEVLALWLMVSKLHETVTVETVIQYYQRLI
ncbi:hypothetical protein SK128_007647, partial [Halocaridina rubra]